MTKDPHAYTDVHGSVMSAKRGLLEVSRAVFWGAHPTTVRLILGLSSALWALVLLLDPQALTRWPYQYMLMIMPTWSWCVCFSLHFVASFWRIFDQTPRIYWALCTNTLGCFLWLTLTICINLRAGMFIPGSSLEVIISLFSVWSLIRTGLGKDMGTP